MTFCRIANTKNAFPIAGKISGPLTIAEDVAVENGINDNYNCDHLLSFH